MQRERTMRIDLAAVTLLVITVVALLSVGTYDPADAPSGLVYRSNAHTVNLCGEYGALLAHVLLSLFGVGAYAVVGGFGVATVLLFARVGLKDPALRAVGMAMALVGICVLAAKLLPNSGGGFLPVVGAGGYVGAMALTVLEWHLTAIGVWLVLLGALSVGLVLVADTLVARLVPALATGPWRAARSGLGLAEVLGRFGGQRGAVQPAVDDLRPEDIDEPDSSLEEEQEDAEYEAEESGEEEEEAEAAAAEAAPPKSAPAAPAPEIRVNTPNTRAAGREEPAPEQVMAALEAASRGETEADYTLPPLTLLEAPEEFPYELHEKQIRRKALLLEKTFQEFGYSVKVVEIDTGPVITRYEISLEAGLRLSKITSLSDDLAIALRVASVRVVAPIPGKNTVGVEVPNDRRALVRLREVIENTSTAKMRIPLFLGMDVSGDPVVCDLADMPHLLIAGRTGTGKSVCLNAMILSILMTRTPSSIRLLMIDPKMVELAPYRRVPHLMHPVVTDMKKAEAILAWAVDKMEERYDLLARCGVRHIDVYNELGEEEIFDRLGPMDDDERARIPAHMPYIVIFGDEIADLMMTAPKEVEGYIIRLAQKSRAVGIHLVLATQKPTVDVITGLIKSNLPARICFQVASRSDSRVVLDEIGAEKLLSGGDMLYLLPGTSTMIRAQGTFVGDKEVNDVVAFLGTNEPQYSRELVQLKPAGSDGFGAAALRHRDDMYEPAIEIVVREGRGSVSLLQRALGIGYGRAARLIDYMAEDGIVGEYNGSQAREVLLTPEQWREMAGGDAEVAKLGNPTLEPVETGPVACGVDAEPAPETDSEAWDEEEEEDYEEQGEDELDENYDEQTEEEEFEEDDEEEDEDEDEL